MDEYSNVNVETGVAVPMRDGVVLRADVYRPAGVEQVPALVLRIPYSKALWKSVEDGDILRMARHGYGVVVQDVRGRFESEGTFYPFEKEADDGYDTVEWAARQPWSTGKIGMYGISYCGATQWLAATAAPPHLRAIYPQLTSSDYYEGWIYQGGALALGFALSWALILAGDTVTRNRRQLGDSYSDAVESYHDAVDALRAGCAHLPLKGYSSLRGKHLSPYYYDWLEHPTYDEWWSRWSIASQHSKILCPALNLGGWHDIFLGGTLHNYTGMRQGGGSTEARAGQRLIVGPWAHTLPIYANQVGGFDYGVRCSGITADLDGMALRWFGYWLKGVDDAVSGEAPVRLFIMGENAWRDEQEWPLARAVDHRYYFHSRGRANSLHGDGALSCDPPGEEPDDIYLYDPRNPVPTMGGGLCCSANIPGGAFDQRGAEDRPDVLVFTSEPLKTSLEATGLVRVVLYASSSAADTDFTAKLVDVEPCGFCRNLTDGIMRARYRTSTHAERLLVPGQVQEYVIDLVATANLFKEGHRIRVEVSSSNFPRFDRNPNTGHGFGEDDLVLPAVQTVHHSARLPSHIVLPVVTRP